MSNEKIDATPNVQVVSALAPRPRGIAANRYRLQKVSYHESSKPTIQLGGTTLSKYQIPNIAHNLAESFVRIEGHLAATADYFGCYFGSTNGRVKRVSLKTDANVVVDEIQYVPQFLKVVRPATTSLEEFLTLEGNYPSRANNVIERGNMFAKSDALASYVPTALDTSGKYINAAGTGVEDGAINYMDIGQIISGAVVNTAVYISTDFKLSDLKHTYFAKDLDIVYNTTMILEVEWSQGKDWGFECKTLATIADYRDLNTVPVIDNAYLYLAVVKDPEFKNKMIAKITQGGGIKTILPTVFSIKKSFSATAETRREDLHMSFTNMDRVLRIYSTWMLATEDGPAKFNNNNTFTITVADGKIDATPPRVTSLRTYVDGDAQQDEEYTYLNGLDWHRMKTVLAGSVIQNRGMFQKNYFWVDDWSGLRSIDWPANDDKISGFQLGTPGHQQMKYSIEFAKPGTALSMFQFVVGQRVLTIDASGVSVNKSGIVT